MGAPGMKPRTADVPLLVLCVAGLALVVGLGLVAAQLSVPYSLLVACKTVAATLLARAGFLAILVPYAVAAIAVVAALLSAVHQVWATRRVLAGVLGRIQEPSPRLSDVADQAGVLGLLDLTSDASAYTFCHGYWRPRICLSSGLVELLEDEELAAILRHEAHHVRNRDPLKILVARSVASGLFFLPIAGTLRDSYFVGKEACADGEASGTDNGLALARALVKMLRAHRPCWPAGVLAIGAFSATDRRLQRLLAPERWRLPRPALGECIWSLVLVGIIVGSSYAVASAARSDAVKSACLTKTGHEACPTGHDTAAETRATPSRECNGLLRYSHPSRIVP